MDDSRSRLDRDPEKGHARCFPASAHKTEAQMGKNLKPINEQVIVITGASSGIGLATALLAAESGAKLVVAARTKSTPPAYAM